MKQCFRNLELGKGLHLRWTKLSFSSWRQALLHLAKEGIRVTSKELHIRFEAVKCTGNHVHHFQGISPAEDATSKQLKWAIWWNSKRSLYSTPSIHCSLVFLKMRLRLLASSCRGCVRNKHTWVDRLSVPFWHLQTVTPSDLSSSLPHLSCDSKNPQGLPCGCPANPWFWNRLGYRISHGPQAVPKSTALPCPCLDCLTLCLLFCSGLGRRGLGLGFRLGFDLRLRLRVVARSGFRLREWDSFRTSFNVHGLLGP